MRNDLMSEEVEIDPFGGGPSFRAAEQFPIESTRFGKIAHGKGEMKAGTGVHGRIALLFHSSGEKQGLLVKGSLMRLMKAPFRRKAPALVRRELLKIDDNIVPVTLRLNTRARRLIVKVHPATGEVTVVAPSRRALDEALDFARGEQDWIARRLAHVPKPITLTPGTAIPYRGVMHTIRLAPRGPSPVWTSTEDGALFLNVGGRAEHAPRRVMDFLKREARRIVDERAQFYSASIGVTPSRITMRDTTSRWGSCSSNRVLSFSWRLIFAPEFALDYVVAHEVAHLVHMNHGVRFWKLLHAMVPDVERAQSWLGANATELHRYAPRVIE